MWMSFMTWIRVTAHWVVSDCGLGKGYRLHAKQKLGCVGLHMHVVRYVCAWNFRTKFL